VSEALDAISRIRKLTTPETIDPAERVLGRLDADLDYADLSEIARVGFREYLQSVQARVHEAGVLVQQTYFLK
jgi:hypothetical protein